jgi:hypothetical protein
MPLNLAAYAPRLRRRTLGDALKHAFAGTTTRSHGREAQSSDINLQHRDIEHASSSTPNQVLEKPLVDITLNRIVRATTILTLGFSGGWSLIPDETKVPVGKFWVTYIVLITDWCASLHLHRYDIHQLSS